VVANAHWDLYCDEHAMEDLRGECQDLLAACLVDGAGSKRGADSSARRAQLAAVVDDMFCGGITCNPVERQAMLKRRRVALRRLRPGAVAWLRRWVLPPLTLLFVILYRDLLASVGLPLLRQAGASGAVLARRLTAHAPASARSLFGSAKRRRAPAV